MDRAEQPDVSIVVPLYDEEENVSLLCKAVHTALKDWDRSYELILVDDGSRDRTLTRALEQQKENPNIRVLAFRSNVGQTRAMSAGFFSARAPIVVSMDGDLQNDPRDIPSLLRRIDEGFDLVCGWRRDRKDSWLSRRLPSRIANWLISSLTGIRIHDTGCTLKAHRAQLIRSFRLYSDMHRFLPAMLSIAGARITEVEVRHHPRRHGANKYGLSRVFGVLADICTIKMLSQFCNRPGVWFLWMALPWFLLFMLALIVTIVRVWLGESATVVFQAVALLSLYIASQLLGLAVLSEIYLAHSDRRYLRKLATILTVPRRSARLIGGT